MKNFWEHFQSMSCKMELTWRFKPQRHKAHKEKPNNLCAFVVKMVLLLILPYETAFTQQETIYMSVRSSSKTRLGVSDNPTIGLFVSRDAGATWEHHGWRDQIKVFYTEAGSDGTIWSACGNGVLRSTDGGATWKITTGWEVTEALKVK